MSRWATVRRLRIPLIRRSKPAWRDVRSHSPHGEDRRLFAHNEAQSKAGSRQRRHTHFIALGVVTVTQQVPYSHEIVPNFSSHIDVASIDVLLLHPLRLARGIFLST